MTLATTGAADANELTVVRAAAAVSSEPNLHLTRRAFLAVIAAAGATACSGAVTEERTSPASSDPAAPSPAARPSGQAPSPTATDAASSAFEPIAGDTHPNAKRVAGRFVQSLLTYDAADRPRALLAKAVRDVDDEFDVAGARKRVERLFVRGATSRGEIVYPQLAGLTVDSGTDRASVMVVARQHLSGGAAPAMVTRTLDVRLVRRGEQWRVEDLPDVGGAPPETPADGLPDVARQVLEDTRIELPDSARWDILAGGTDERLLRTMLDLAAVAPFAVTVLKSGHPENVFGTDRVSGHTLGRGADIWRIAGQPVVLQGSDATSDAHRFTTSALKDFDVPELGSPWDLDGPPVPGTTKPSFTDAVHADHIHMAFKAP